MRRVLIVLPALALLGCDKKPEPAPGPESVSTPNPAPDSQPAPTATVVPPEAPDATIETGPPEAVPETAPETAPDPEAPIISEKMRDRIRFKLKQDGGVSVRLDPIIHRVHDDGSSTVYALAHRSEFEICVKDGGGGKEARVACHAEQATDDLERKMPRTSCTRRSVLKASFGRPRPGKEWYGGKLTIDGEYDIEAGCEQTSLRRFDFEDIDEDGIEELVVEDRSQWPEGNWRTGGQSWPGFRDFVVLGPNLELHTHLGTGTHESEGLTVDELYASRWRFEDRNDDGKPDLVLERMDYVSTGMCDYDADMWPTPDEGDEEVCARAAKGEAAHDEDLDTIACCGKVETTVAFWDAEEDGWPFEDEDP